MKKFRHICFRWCYFCFRRRFNVNFHNGIYRLCWNRSYRNKFWWRCYGHYQWRNKLWKNTGNSTTTSSVSDRILGVSASALDIRLPAASGFLMVIFYNKRRSRKRQHKHNNNKNYGADEIDGRTYCVRIAIRSNKCILRWFFKILYLLGRLEI